MPKKRGRVAYADRLQRILMALVLIFLNLFGIFESPTYPKFIALAIQLELLLTGLIGWCPFYWSLGIGHDDESS